MTARPRETRSDHASLERWAAEHVAIELGLLRECPYHGEPLRTATPRSRLRDYCGFASYDPLVTVFRGDASALVDSVERAADAYGPACAVCERESSV
jgi:hypothetical protein